MKSKLVLSVRGFFYTLGLGLLLIVGCKNDPIRENPGIPVKLTPWEAYLAALDSNGLANTQMAKHWKQAGEKALNDSILIAAPFQETGYVRAEKPIALAYRLNLKSGEQLNISLVSEPDSILFFVDLFQEETTDSTRDLRPLLHAVPYDTDSISFEVKTPGTYLLRLQPELLVSSRYTLSIITQPIYGTFPVSGKSNSAIWSFFGAPRDGGKRTHKGIDIFARRGTPVVAVTEGVVRSVRDRGLGGKQVWLRDNKRGQSLYYAHLDSQLVAEGVQVKAGDTLGLVGNTGNAKNTRPHLHFSIYRRGQGAIDPHPFVAKQSKNLPRLSTDTTLLGKMARVRTRTSNLRSAPTNKGASFASLDRHMPLRILAATQQWYRVSTPEGLTGYLSASSLETLDRPIKQIKIAQVTELLHLPHPEAPPVSVLPADEEASVLGQNESFQLVRGPDGGLGWMRL